MSHCFWLNETSHSEALAAFVYQWSDKCLARGPKLLVCPGPPEMSRQPWAEYYVVDYKCHHEQNINQLTRCRDTVINQALHNRRWHISEVRTHCRPFSHSLERRGAQDEQLSTLAPKSCCSRLCMLTLQSVPYRFQITLSRHLPALDRLLTSHCARGTYF